MNNTVLVDITIPSHTRYLGLIGKLGETVVSELNLCPGKHECLCQSINMVLTEALVNAITHVTTTDQDKGVQIHISASNEELTIRVYDHGKGFNLNRFTENDCPDPLQEHGRGIFIMRSLMDSVEYQKINGNGNVLILRKKLDRSN